MCATYGYSGFGKNENLGYERFRIVNRLDNIEDSSFTYPKQTAPIVIAHSPNKLHLAQWGFPVAWSPRPLINAKAESVDTLAIFAESFRLRRCLVVAQVFYEWDHRITPPQMTAFRLKDNSLFALAGLYKEFPDHKTGTVVTHFVILTTTPNELVQPIHTRMAVLLKKEQEQTWLNPDIVEPDILKPLLTPYPANEMESSPVERKKTV